MTVTTTRKTVRSDFSEVRDLERQHTLAVIAASTVAASGCLIAAALVTLGVIS